MNEETFNMALRRFLKDVGVTSQREIEIAVRKAVDGGSLGGTKTLTAKAVITIEGVDLNHEVTGEIALE